MTATWAEASAFFDPSQPRDENGRWAKTGGSDVDTIRSWGINNGYHQTPVSGRIPNEVVEAYRKAQNAPPPKRAKPGFKFDHKGREVRAFSDEEPGYTLLEILESPGDAGEDAQIDAGHSISYEFSEATKTKGHAEVEGWAATMSLEGTLPTYGELGVEDEALDPDQPIGQYSRKFYEEDGELVVSHASFKIEDDYMQGQGHGSDFIRRSEEYYRTLGVDKIVVYANIDVGGYAWARMGFNWVRPDIAMERINTASDYDDGSAKFSADLDAVLAKANRYDETGDMADLPTAFEVSQMGRTEGATTWPGKELLLGQNWDGEKILTYPDVSRETNLSSWEGLRTDFFDPQQPRDENGRWTSRGGSSGGTAKGSLGNVFREKGRPTEADVRGVAERLAERFEGRVLSVERSRHTDDGAGFVDEAHIAVIETKNHVRLQMHVQHSLIWDNVVNTVDLYVDPEQLPNLTEEQLNELGAMEWAMAFGLNREEGVPSEHINKHISESVTNERSRRNEAARQAVMQEQEAERARREEQERIEAPKRAARVNEMRERFGDLDELGPGHLKEALKVNDYKVNETAAYLFQQSVQDGLIESGLSNAEIEAWNQGNSIDFRIELKNDADGTTIGTAERSMKINDDGELVVFNKSFTMAEEYQGQGYGSSLTQVLENNYRQLGVDRVDTFANIDVGGYAWARLGFNWRQGREYDNYGQVINRVRRNIEDDVDARDYEAISARAEQAYASADMSAMPTAFEVSRIGYREGKTEWAGKQGMLRSHWDATKRLTPVVPRETSDLAEMITAFYDPQQPRAEDGKWTKGAGSSKHATAREMIDYGDPPAEAIRTVFGKDTKVDLTGLGPEQRELLAGYLVDFDEKYPGVTLKGVITRDMGPGTGGMVELEGLNEPGTLVINPTTFTRDYATQEPGWNAGTGTRYLVAHEFAHLLHLTYIGEKAVQPRFGERTGGINASFREASRWRREYEGKISREIVEADTSGYGYFGGVHELLAEAFADVEVNGAAKAKPLHKFMHGKLADAYRQKSGTQLAELITAFYDPSQPRDERGRWAKGGSSGFDGSKFSTERAEFEGMRDHVMDQATDQELAAADVYADSWIACNNMNGHLRYGSPSADPNGVYAEAARRVEALQSLIDKTPPISREVELQRGVTYTPEDWGSMGSLEGMVIQDKAFISTTMRDDVAQQFATDSGDEGEGVRMRIKVPAGTKVLPLSAINSREVNDMTGEYESPNYSDEFLLPPGTKFRVIRDGRGYTSRRREIDVEVIA